MDTMPMDWDATIENDGSGGGGYVVLPAGEYPFRVVNFTRAVHEPRDGGKLPKCNKAVLTIEVLGPNDEVCEVEHHLFLYSTQEGFLCEFFRAIGARQHGERMVMDWSKVIGATGRCKTYIHKYTGTRDGKEHDATRIKRFLDPPAGQQQAQLVQQRQPATQENTNELLPF